MKKIAPGIAIEVLGYAASFKIVLGIIKVVTFRPGFYLTFWQLSTYDLSPPTSKYEEECNALRSLSRQEDGLYTSADRSSDRAKRATAYTHREKRNRMNGFVIVLLEEMKQQTAARSFTIKRLAREKLHWFAHGVCPSSF